MQTECSVLKPTMCKYVQDFAVSCIFSYEALVNCIEKTTVYFEEYTTSHSEIIVNILYVYTMLISSCTLEI